MASVYLCDDLKHDREVAVKSRQGRPHLAVVQNWMALVAGAGAKR